MAKISHMLASGGLILERGLLFLGETVPAFLWAKKPGFAGGLLVPDLFAAAVAGNT